MITGMENADNKKWYKVAFTYNQQAMTGYVCADYVETTATGAFYNCINHNNCENRNSKRNQCQYP